MKLAITVTAPQIEASLDPRFGRGAYFIVINAETHEWHASPNPAGNAGGGAGAQAAQFVADLGAQAVVSGRFGPTAYTALDTAGVKMFTAQGGTADELLEEYLAGGLEPVSKASGPGFHQGGHGRRESAG